MKTTTGSLDRQPKLLALALNPAATEGESVAAFLKFKRTVLRSGNAAAWLSPGGQGSTVPAFARCRVPFGQHRWQSLGWMAENEPHCLEWLGDIAREPHRRAVELTLQGVDREERR